MHREAPVQENGLAAGRDGAAPLLDLGFSIRPAEDVVGDITCESTADVQHSCCFRVPHVNIDLTMKASTEGPPDAPASPTNDVSEAPLI